MTNSPKQSPQGSRPPTPSTSQTNNLTPVDKARVEELERKMAASRQTINKFQNHIQELSKEIQEAEEEIKKLTEGKKDIDQRDQEVAEAFQKAEQEADEMIAQVQVVEDLIKNWKASRQNNP